jgi:hypothetical protein
MVFHNNPTPVLPEGHVNVDEQIIDDTAECSWGGMMHWKYRLRHRLDLTGIGKVLFLDCDIIALRSINHLMLGGWDIYSAPEPGRIVEFPFNGYLTEAEMETCKDQPGLNAGTLGIRASVFMDVMSEWERLDGLEPIRRWIATDQHSWNRLVLDTPLRHRHFGEGEVQFPFIHSCHYLRYRRAGLVHACDRTPEEKFHFLYGLWVDAFGRGEFEKITRT